MSQLLLPDASVLVAMPLLPDLVGVLRGRVKVSLVFFLERLVITRHKLLELEGMYYFSSCLWMSGKNDSKWTSMSKFPLWACEFLICLIPSLLDPRKDRWTRVVFANVKGQRRWTFLQSLDDIWWLTVWWWTKWWFCCAEFQSFKAFLFLPSGHFETGLAQLSLIQFPNSEHPILKELPHVCELELFPFRKRVTKIGAEGFIATGGDQHAENSQELDAMSDREGSLRLHFYVSALILCYLTNMDWCLFLAGRLVIFYATHVGFKFYKTCNR